MIIVVTEEYEIPDKCPEDCPFKPELESFSQGIICMRCPVFCCTVPKDGFPLVEKSSFRKDWAKEWAKWFKGDKKEYPNLKIFPEEQ